MCSAPRLSVKGASSPKALRQRALGGNGRRLRAGGGLESLGEGCLVGSGLPGRSTGRSPDIVRCISTGQRVTGHPVPVLWDSAGAWQAERVRGGAGGCLGGGCGRGDVESMSGWGKEFRQSLPSLAVSPSRTLGPIAECAAFHTHA